jgi:hypothetical protein
MKAGFSYDIQIPRYQMILFELKVEEVYVGDGSNMLVEHCL